MPEPVDLLLITLNRRAYLEKSLRRLFESDANFRLYWWDNGSTDGAREIGISICDERLVEKRFSNENVNQYEPSIWFLANAKSDVVGKIDDDILLPEGWIDRLQRLIRANEQFGMLGCWIFMEDDWIYEIAKHKVLSIGGEQIFRNLTIQGQSFLARKATLQKYIVTNKNVWGWPINQKEMTRNGLVNGYPIPIMYGHNMDDPRSEYCLMNASGGFGEQAALTARLRQFSSVEEYSAWIESDARRILETDLETQLNGTLNQGSSVIKRIYRKLFK